jgi:hypothetical protein
LQRSQGDNVPGCDVAWAISRFPEVGGHPVVHCLQKIVLFEVQARPDGSVSLKSFAVAHDKEGSPLMNTTDCACEAAGRNYFSYLFKAAFENTPRIPLRGRGLAFFALLWICALFTLHLSMPVADAAVDLGSLLDATQPDNSGTVTITLNPATPYTISDAIVVTTDTVIMGQGASISIAGRLSGPLAVDGGRSLKLDNCVIQSSAWAAVRAQNGGRLTLTNHCTISSTNSNGTAVSVDNGDATMENSEIKDSVYGINATKTCKLVLNAVDIRGCQYSFMQEGGTLDWNGGTINQPSGAAVYVTKAPATFTGLRVEQKPANSYGFTLAGSALRSLHGVTVSGSQHGVMVDGGTAVVDQNSNFQSSSDGGGLVSLNGAAITVQDSTFIGFGNAIDVQSDGIPGTAFVQNCSFYNSIYSAFCAKNAVNVWFSQCLVQDVKMDGLYFERSTGIVDNTIVQGSLNTGITFLNCPGGGTIQNSVVAGSVHQGVAISEGSKKIRVLNNTLANNIIANVLVDRTSKAVIQGNVMYGTPDFNVRLQGTKGSKLESNLIAYSEKGVEIKESSNPQLALCAIINNDKGGILVYDNAPMTLLSSFLRYNDLRRDGNYAVYVSDGAQGTVRGCRIGPRGNMGVYNNAGTQCDLASNYWDASSGPAVPGKGKGGAVLDWNTNNGSKVAYQPYQKKANLLGSVTHDLALESGGSLGWKSAAGVTLALTAKPEAEVLSQQVAGALRCKDTSSLGSWKLPNNLIPGQLYTVWVDYALRANSAAGSLVFQVPGFGGTVELLRRTPAGSWVAEPAAWDPITHRLVYTPADRNNLNGTFVLVQGSAS